MEALKRMLGVRARWRDTLRRMLLLFIAAAVAGAILTQGSGVFAIAVVNALLSFLANGVMANFIPCGPKCA